MGCLLQRSSGLAGSDEAHLVDLVGVAAAGQVVDGRLGGYAAYGPILQGLNAPINDLSRGCNADEVYKMSLITACQS